jgi:hypothetical protein
VRVPVASTTWWRLPAASYSMEVAGVESLYVVPVSRFKAS